MTRFVIQETLTYYDEYEVEATSKEEAIAIHRFGHSMRCSPMTFSDGEIVDVLEDPPRSPLDGVPGSDPPWGTPGTPGVGPQR